MDATVSGNAAQAAVGDIMFMIGGELAPAAAAQRLLAPLSRAVHTVGGVGSGARPMLVVNHVLSINRAAVAERLAVAENAGLALEPVLAVLCESTAYSKAMDIWGIRIVNGDQYPSASRVRQSHEDSRLISEHAERVGASAQLAGAVRASLAEAEANGMSDADNSSVMEVMRRRAGMGRIPTDEDAVNPAMADIGS